MFYLARVESDRQRLEEVTGYRYRSAEGVKEQFKRMYRCRAIMTAGHGEYVVAGDDGLVYFIFTGTDGAGRLRWKWAPRQMRA